MLRAWSAASAGSKCARLMPTSAFQPVARSTLLRRAMSAGVTTSATHSGNGFGGCWPAGTHRVSRSSWLPPMRTLRRPRLWYSATRLPCGASKLPTQSPGVVHRVDSSRIS